VLSRRPVYSRKLGVFAQCGRQFPGALHAKCHRFDPCSAHWPEVVVANRVTVWITFGHFFVRRLMLVKYSYAFVALPGGYGTLDEVFEVATLVQTGKIHDFPVASLAWSTGIRC